MGEIEKIRASERNVAMRQQQLELYKSRKDISVSSLENLQTHFDAAILERKTLLKSFTDDFPQLQAGNPIRYEEIAVKSEERKETVVSYFVGKNSMYQWVVSNGDIRFNRLANSKEERDAIVADCINLITFFDGPSKILNAPNDYAVKAFQLYKKMQFPKDKKVIIVPDGILSFVPFDGLLTAATTAVSFSDMPYLIRSSEVSYLLSMNEYLKPNEEIPALKTLGVFPVFKGSPKELGYSLQEAKNIKDEVKATLLMNASATVSAFIKNEATHNLLHISSHAYAGSFENEAGIEFADSILTVDALYGHQFRKDLVVLSACETGVGKIMSGEGVQSIARAFQYAGAKNIMFSLWKVNDFTTTELMSNYYANLAETKSFNTSLHRAKLGFLDNADIDDVKKSPYNWAAFVYYGNTQLFEESSNQLWWLLLVIIPLLLLFFLRKRKSRN